MPAIRRAFAQSAREKKPGAVRDEKINKFIANMRGFACGLARSPPQSPIISVAWPLSLFSTSCEY
jgi:hypothetical protein